MKIGTAQIDITPSSSVELSGFAVRIQPAQGVLDPIYAKALYLSDRAHRLLWVHCDLIGFSAATVDAFRQWAKTNLGLGPSEIMLSATHTHSAPATIHLEQAGRIDPAYMESLQRQLEAVATAAMAQTQACTVVTAQGRLDLAIDRRRQPSRHTDPTVAGIGFRRADGTFAAAILNYAIHPVALGSTNRAVSADLMGRAADALSARLPGRPLVLATNGACGNLNPPALDVTTEQLDRWGRQVADAILPALLTATSAPEASFSTAVLKHPLPLDVLDPAALAAYADAALQDGSSAKAWRGKYQGVVTQWRDALVTTWRAGDISRSREAELFAVELGGVILLGVNAEVFSPFAETIRRALGRTVYVVGYANGNMGYLSPREAYAEGGYEVEAAHFFYGGYRFKSGAFEQLAAAAVDFLRKFPSLAGQSSS